MPIQQFTLQTALDELGFTMQEFIDLCVMLGCDYAGTVKGVGQVKALELMKKYKTIEECMASLDKTKYTFEESLLEEIKIAKNEFVNPEVTPAKDVNLTWGECDADGLIAFLVTDKQFSEERVKNNIAKLQKMKKGSTQGRLDSFFKVQPSTGPSATHKRKLLEQKAKDAKKKAKTGSWGKKKK